MFPNTNALPAHKHPQPLPHMLLRVGTSFDPSFRKPRAGMRKDFGIATKVVRWCANHSSYKNREASNCCVFRRHTGEQAKPCKIETHGFHKNSVQKLWAQRVARRFQLIPQSVLRFNVPGQLPHQIGQNGSSGFMTSVNLVDHWSQMQPNGLSAALEHYPVFATLFWKSLWNRLYWNDRSSEC